MMPSKLLKNLIFLCLMLGMSSAIYATNQLNFEINGIKGEIRNNVATSLGIERKALGEHPKRPAIREFYRKSKTWVKDAITPYGYFNPVIKTKLQRKNGGWLIRYDIILGKPVKYQKMDIRILGPGNKNRKILKYINQFPIKPGDTFTADSYNNAKDEFFEIVNNQGYIKARLIKSKVLINTNQRNADIVLYMESGPRYYFGSLRFNKTPFAESFLRRFDIFHHNEHFSNERLNEYQQEMNDTSYFSSVVVIPDIEGTENNQVPIDVSIVPPKARYYNFGLGYGTLTKARVSAGVTFNRISDSGHSLDAKIKLSSVLSGGGIKYTIPGSKPLYEWWTINANYQDFQPPNASSRSESLALNYLRKYKRWVFTAGINLLNEQYRIIKPNGQKEPRETAVVLYPSLDATYLKTNDILKPTHGIYFNTNLKAASKALISTTSFAQGVAKGKYLFTPLDFAQFVFRGTLGLTAVNNLTDLPASLQFYAGGPNSVRGFSDSKIGPGKYLMIGSAEYRNLIFENWAAAVFYDIGKATNHFTTPWSRGTGVGLIYYSPVGPIKLYVAWAVSKPGTPRAIEFVMGPDF